jgi:hypothetical protein
MSPAVRFLGQPPVDRQPEDDIRRHEGVRFWATMMLVGAGIVLFLQPPLGELYRYLFPETPKKPIPVQKQPLESPVESREEELR